MKTIYDGLVVLDSNGEAVVDLPPWFEALNMDFRYQLTPIGSPSPGLFVGQKIQQGRFRISGGHPNGEVCWQVTGIRQDVWAKAHRVAVERDKPASERGHYMHPELHGKSPQQGIKNARYPETEKQSRDSEELRRQVQTRLGI